MSKSLKLFLGISYLIILVAFLLLISLSDKIKHVLPSLTEVSASSLIFSILSFKEEEISKVQSIVLVFFEKNFLNFLSYHQKDSKLYLSQLGL